MCGDSLRSREEVINQPKRILWLIIALIVPLPTTVIMVLALGTCA